MRLRDAASWYRTGLETALRQAKDELAQRARDAGRPLYPDEVEALLDAQLLASHAQHEGVTADA